MTNRDGLGLRRTVYASRHTLREVSFVVDGLPSNAAIVGQLLQTVETLTRMQTLQICSSLVHPQADAATTTTTTMVSVGTVTRLLRSTAIAQQLTTLCLCFTYSIGWGDTVDVEALAHAAALPHSRLRNLKFWMHAPHATGPTGVRLLTMFHRLGEAPVRLEDADLALFGVGATLQPEVFRGDGWKHCALRLHGPLFI